MSRQPQPETLAGIMKWFVFLVALFSPLSLILLACIAVVAVVVLLALLPIAIDLCLLPVRFLLAYGILRLPSSWNSKAPQASSQR